jgi:hypothetical protein
MYFLQNIKLHIQTIKNAAWWNQTYNSLGTTFTTTLEVLLSYILLLIFVSSLFIIGKQKKKYDNSYKTWQ